MHLASLRTASWLLFRACVSLRQILALKKPRAVGRARKAAAICGTCLALMNYAVARDEPLPSAPASSAADPNIDAEFERIRPLREVGTSIAPPPGELPANMAQRRFANEPTTVAAELSGRGWMEFAYLWQASAMSYQPLYFEEPNLERYGHSARCILQPPLSGAHFLFAVPALPIRMVLERPWQCVYPLGHARPGSPALWSRPW
jgi:hypothetical protein